MIPEIGPKNFVTFEKQAPGHTVSGFIRFVLQISDLHSVNWLCFMHLLY